MKLSAYNPLMQAANVRCAADVKNWEIGQGLGQQGDLVLVETLQGASSFQLVDRYGNELNSAFPSFILAVLGNRDSSTHVSGVIPRGGLPIRKGIILDWIGGMSGIIGKCLETKDSAGLLNVEISSRVKAVGLVKKNGRVINILDFALRPTSKKLKIPVLFFAATSAEAGKTTLMGKAIEMLSAKGKRVAAIKTSGTGGILDCKAYREAGAAITADQVDCGLITTYIDKSVFKKHIINAYLHAQDLGAEIIVAEMGGDILWGNSPELLQMVQIASNVKGLFVINNDPLALLGMEVFLRKTSKEYPVYYFSSPFRNYLGMKRRARKISHIELYDVNDKQKIRSILNQLLLKTG